VKLRVILQVDAAGLQLFEHTLGLISSWPSARIGICLLEIFRGTHTYIYRNAARRQPYYSAAFESITTQDTRL